MKQASPVTFSNWNGSATSTPSVVVRPRDVDELMQVVKDEGRYPTPVRAGENAFTMDVTDHRANHPLWIEFNKRFNSLVADFGGRPLLNQTKELDREIVHRMLGEDWKRFVAQREAEDPGGRFLSDYYRDLI